MLDYFFRIYGPYHKKIVGEGDCHYIITKINISSCLISDEKATTYVHIPVLGEFMRMLRWHYRDEPSVSNRLKVDQTKISKS